MNMEIVVDASGIAIGRLASYVAKQAMLGKNVIVVNCKDAVVVGKPNSVIDEYNTMGRRGGSSQKGPFFPKAPDRLVKRTVRGMVAHRQGRGEAALKRVLCFNDLPQEYSTKEKISPIKKTDKKSIRLEDLERAI